MQARDRAWSEVQRIFEIDEPATRFQHNMFSLAIEPSVATIVTVVREDSIAASYGYAKPLVLVFADADVPGGCVNAGAGMQEESIFRRTGIHRRLLKSLYPISPHECLYCPDVRVVFDSEARGYAAIDRTASFVACPGIKFPELVENHTRLNDDDATLLGAKVETLVELAVRNGHDCLVLGALGCGVWGCPPRHVAEIMVRAVRSSAVGRLKNVVFACPGNVHDAFSEALASIACSHNHGHPVDQRRPLG